MASAKFPNYDTVIKEHRDVFKKTLDDVKKACAASDRESYFAKLFSAAEQSQEAAAAVYAFQAMVVNWLEVTGYLKEQPEVGDKLQRACELLQRELFQLLEMSSLKDFVLTIDSYQETWTGKEKDGELGSVRNELVKGARNLVGLKYSMQLSCVDSAMDMLQEAFDYDKMKGKCAAKDGSE